MQLEEGKFYKSREGYKVGPLVHQSPGSTWPWSGKWVDKDNTPRSATFNDKGRAGYDVTQDMAFDLVSIWVREEKQPKQIDQLSYLDFRKGIDKLWKIGRAF